MTLQNLISNLLVVQQALRSLNWSEQRESKGGYLKSYLGSVQEIENFVNGLNRMLTFSYVDQLDQVPMVSTLDYAINNSTVESLANPTKEDLSYMFSICAQGCGNFEDYVEDSDKEFIRGVTERLEELSDYFINN